MLTAPYSHFVVTIGLLDDDLQKLCAGFWKSFLSQEKLEHWLALSLTKLFIFGVFPE
jgi:hypothetical protein